MTPFAVSLLAHAGSDLSLKVELPFEKSCNLLFIFMTRKLP